VCVHGRVYMLGEAETDDRCVADTQAMLPRTTGADAIAIFATPTLTMPKVCAYHQQQQRYSGLSVRNGKFCKFGDASLETATQAPKAGDAGSKLHECLRRAC
jgi:hypothetical protein